MSEISLHLNRVCNLNCPYCFARKLGLLIDNRPGPNVPIDKLVAFIDKRRYQTVVFTGNGETTLTNNFPEIYDKITTIESVKQVRIYTNVCGQSIAWWKEFLVNNRKKLHIEATVHYSNITSDVNCSNILELIQYVRTLGEKITIGTTFVITPYTVEHYKYYTTRYPVLRNSTLSWDYSGLTYDEKKAIVDKVNESDFLLKFNRYNTFIFENMCWFGDAGTTRCVLSIDDRFEVFDIDFDGQTSLVCNI